jgi:acetyl esterase/lipase
MSFRFAERLDPEIAQALDLVPHYDLVDIPADRERRRQLAASTAALAEPVEGVVVTTEVVPGRAPGGVAVRVHRPESPTPDAGRLLWLHGGGHVLGEAAQDDWLMAELVAATGCTAVAVEWRRAPEDPYPAALHDGVDALRWLARTPGGPLVVGGASSGGGLAAGVVLWARDSGEVAVDGQLLIYPMLDDREQTVSSRGVTDHRVWNRDLNRRAWAAYLSGLEPGAAVPPYAAPSRTTDLAGLPPTWIGTAELDAFVDENLDYAARLLAAGVSTELHVYPGAVHGFDLFAPEAAVSRRFARERLTAFQRLLGDVRGG